MKMNQSGILDSSENITGQCLTKQAALNTTEKGGVCHPAFLTDPASTYHSGSGIL
jgi:hypothetical protein